MSDNHVCCGCHQQAETDATTAVADFRDRLAAEVRESGMLLPETTKMLAEFISTFPLVAEK